MEALDAAANHPDREFEAEVEIEAVASDEKEDEDPLQDKEGTEESSSSPFPQLESMLGIGPVALDSLLTFAKSKELFDATKNLAESLNVLEQDVVVVEEEEDPSEAKSSDSSALPWKGFRVVFTGSLGIKERLTRSRAQEFAKQLGAKATPGSVSKSTDLVVFGDKGGKKLTQARELGISTMEAADFVNLATEHGLIDS